MKRKIKRTIQNYIPIIATALTALFFGGRAKDRISAERTPATTSNNYSDVNDVWKNAVNGVSRNEFNSYLKEVYKQAISIDSSVRENINLKQRNLESKFVSHKDFGNQRKLYLGEYVGQTLIKRFNEFENYFIEYAKETPKEISSEEFMALLVSVSQKESSIGYPNGGRKRDDKMLMGYGSPDRKEFFGARKQVEMASKTLKGAFNEENHLYRMTYSVDGREKYRHILSVYNQGKINKEGLNYADEVLVNYGKWRKEFCDKL